MPAFLRRLATALLSAYLRNPAGQENVAAVVYVGAQLCAGVVINLLWRYAAREGLMHAAITPQVAARTTRTFDISFVAYFTAFVAAFFSAALGVGICLAIALYYSLPSRRRGRHRTSAA